jgi:hypothetical protein
LTRISRCAGSIAPKRQQGAILLRRKTGDDARGERREDERAGQRRPDQLKVTKVDMAVSGDDDMIVQGQPERRRGILDFPGYGDVGG